MKLFVAIEIPLATKKRIESQIGGLREEYSHFNWIPSENFHLTVQFIGEVTDSGKIKVIKDRIAEAVYDVDPFILYSYGADLFMNSDILLYLTFRREKRLEDLSVKIKNSLQLNVDQKYIPHLSIARTRVPSKQQYYLLKKKLHHLPIEISFDVKKIFLFQSILEGQKPIYKKIASFTLLRF